MKESQIFDLCVEETQRTMRGNIGGPFGAAIIDEKGVLVCVASNTVLGDNDPTAHAEMNAIRKATKIMGTHDLSGCTLYATGYPCPMCLSAIIWANIKKVVVACGIDYAEEIGFRDDFIYQFIEGDCQDKEVLDIDFSEQESTDKCDALYTEYARQGKEMY